jgi:hypothetical protein
MFYAYIISYATERSNMWLCVCICRSLLHVDKINASLPKYAMKYVESENNK